MATPRNLEVRQISATTCEIDGRTYRYFAGTNYLSLSFHPAVIESLIAAVRTSGFGLGTSRKTTGTSPEIVALERAIADFMGTEDSIVIGSGMAANIAILEAGLGVTAWLLDDESHMSFRAFAGRCGAAMVAYRHCDVSDFANKLASLHDEKIGVFTDCIFPLSGRVAPVAEIAKQLKNRDHVLVLDESHSLGVLGEDGRGSEVDGPGVLLTSTLGKSLGCIGGMIAGRTSFLDEIRRKASIYSASTALPPSVCQAAMTAFTLLPAAVPRLHEVARAMRKSLEGVPLLANDSGVPIFCMSGSNIEEIHHRCADAGYFLPVIRDYPGMTQPLLRWVVQADHTVEEVTRLGGIIRSFFA